MLTHPEMKRAARRAPDGSAKDYDAVWRKLREEINREKARDQLQSIAIAQPDAHTDPDPNGRLPLVQQARRRDTWARFVLGLPQQDYRPRRSFAASVAADQFCEAKRRGRKRGGR